MSTGKNNKKLFDRDVAIEALTRELKAHFGLEESNDLQDFKNREVEFKKKISRKEYPGKEGQFFIKQKNIPGPITFFEHCQPEADILINDCLLNTLGMVYVFCKDGSNGKSIDTCPDFLMKCIDKACYLRHLFLGDAETKNARTSVKDRIQARGVELVVVCANDLKTDFGNTLRKIAEKTDYLYSIGVNLLTISGSGSEGTQKNSREEKYFDENDLDRAFSWLLPKTREWYKSIPVKGGASLSEITLNNFRLPGQRILTLDKEKKIHLVHGHNGSGKSSIAEALEMVVTGKSERLRDIPDYEKVIRNKDSYSDPNNHASVAIKKEGQKEKKFKVKKTLSPKPRPGKLNATSFRLNQGVMAWLTREDDSDRANVFIDAFFPKDRKIVEDHNDFKAKAEEYFKKLPGSLKDSITSKKTNREDAVIDTLAVLEDEKVKKPRKLVEACLPIPGELLRRLTFLAPGLPGLLESLSARIINETVLKQIDDALEPVFSKIDSILTGLHDAYEILKELNQWHVSPWCVVDFKPTLDKWLDMTTLTDLLEKYHSVVKSLQDAGGKPWDMDEDMAQIFDRSLFTVDAETVKEKMKALALERDRLRTLLESTAPQENKEGVRVTFQPVLSIRETGCLNRLGDWLSYPGLGDRIKEAISKNEIYRFDESLKIGKQGWAARLVENTKELLAVCNELKAVSDREENAEEPGKSCNGRFRNMQNTLETYKKLKNMGKEVHETFLKLLKKDKDGNLIVVLNELINLFTPTRWAYQDISIEHESSKNKHHLHLSIDDPKTGPKKKARADFRLNTAELNIFALSLFTLCAVRNENPLSLLIYDDPLQNMDEITVTTIARGFNKLLKLFPGNWQIMMLFHGREDLERFCREIPAAVYFLPWLSPSTEAEEKKIEPETLPGQVFDGGQYLSEIVEIRV
jgi:energy-coupling factor transporter ATP-binding protein EcfA2